MERGVGFKSYLLERGVGFKSYLLERGVGFKSYLLERGVGKRSVPTHREEGEEGRLADQEGRARGSRVAAEDSSLGQAEALGARRVDNHLLIHRHVSTDAEGLLAVVDEDIGLGIVREDEMGRLGAVERLIGVVHEVDELSHPRLGQVPGQQFGLGDDNGASRSQGLAQGRIFLLQ